MKSVIYLALWVFTFRANATQVKLTTNPLKYAEAKSLFYSEGDTGNSSGWSGCSIHQSTNRKIQIVCQGTTTVLVHGGHSVRKDYLCQYLFEANNANKFLVRYEHCQ